MRRNRQQLRTKDYHKAYRAFVRVVAAFCHFRASSLRATDFRSTNSKSSFWPGKLTHTDYCIDVQLASRQVIRKLRENWPKFSAFLETVDGSNEMRIQGMLDHMYGRELASVLVQKCGAEFLKLGLLPGGYFRQVRGQKDYRSVNDSQSHQPDFVESQSRSREQSPRTLFSLPVEAEPVDGTTEFDQQLSAYSPVEEIVDQNAEETIDETEIDFASQFGCGSLPTESDQDGYEVYA